MLKVQCWPGAGLPAPDRHCLHGVGLPAWPALVRCWLPTPERQWQPASGLSTFSCQVDRCIFMQKTTTVTLRASIKSEPIIDLCVKTWWPKKTSIDPKLEKVESINPLTLRSLHFNDISSSSSRHNLCQCKLSHFGEIKKMANIITLSNRKAFTA